MGNVVDTLLKVIPENDKHCNLKRAEIRRWYESYGKTVLVDTSSRAFAASVLKNDECWNGYKLNRLEFGQKLLSDQENPASRFDLYKLACLLCSGQYIRSIFAELEKNKDFPIEELVIEALGRDGLLMAFWSHYINVVDVENPNPVILESFKKLIGRLNNLDYSNQGDLWKYGFECAKREGCTEALEFFWDELKNQYEQKDTALIDIAMHADYYDIGCSASIIEFCLNNLDLSQYKGKESSKIRSCVKVLGRLLDVCLYEHAKELIICIGPEGISCDEYEVSLIRGTGRQISDVPQESKELAISFLLWLWELKGFEKHREHCLNNLSSMLTVFGDLVEVGALEPVRMVLYSAEPEQIQEPFSYLGHGTCVCYELYIRNERELLSKVFSCIKDGEKFMHSLDRLALCNLEKIIKEKSSQLKVDCIFSLYKQGKRKEFLEYAKPITKNGKELLEDVDKSISCGIGDMLKGKFKFEDLAVASSSLNSVAICCTTNKHSK